MTEPEPGNGRPQNSHVDGAPQTGGPYDQASGPTPAQADAPSAAAQSPSRDAGPGSVPQHQAAGLAQAQVDAGVASGAAQRPAAATADAGLSHEEVAALREAVAPDEASSHRAPLGGGDRRARKKLPLMAREMESFVEFVRRLMAQQLRGSCAVKLLDLELAAHPGMQHEAQTWLLGGMLAPENGEPLGYLGVSPRLGFHLIELAYGGASTPARTLPPRLRLTRVEEETLFLSLRGLLGGLLKALWPSQAAVLRKQPLGNPPQLEEAPGGDAGVVTELELTLGEEKVRIGIIVTPSGLEHLEEAGAAVSTQRPAQRAPAASNERPPPALLMQAHVAATEVDVGVDLGVTHLSMSSLATLQPGHVLWLERGRSDPLVVCVEGRGKFLALPMQRHGSVAVQIIKGLT